MTSLVANLMIYIIDIKDPAVPEQAVPVPDRTGGPNTGTGKLECQEQGSGTGFWPGTQKRSCTITDARFTQIIVVNDTEI